MRPPTSTPRSRLGVALLSLSTAGLIVRWVTMRTLVSEYDVPSYGFPLPAFSWGGASSGEWRAALIPLLVDLLVATAVTLPAAVLIGKRLSGQGMLRLGSAVAVVASLTHAPAMLMWGLGFHRLVLWDWKSPVECREPWVGKPQPSHVHYEDDTRCVRQRKALLEAGKRPAL